MRLAVLGAGVIAWGGCADDASRESGAFTVQDSAGIEVIDVWKPLATGGAGWRLSERPLLRIGAAVTGKPEFQFSWIVGALRVAPDTIVVLDDESLELRFFDGGGAHARLTYRSRRGGTLWPASRTRRRAVFIH